MNHSQRTRLHALRGSWWMAALTFAGLQSPTHASPPDAPRRPAGLTQSLPLAFVPNLGQSDPSVRFQAKSLGGAVFFTPSEVVLALPQSRPGSATSRRHLAGDPREIALGSDEGVPVKFVRIRLIGPAPTAEVAGAARLPGSSHEFIGSDPRRWRANLPTYAGVVYRQVRPGVDLRYDGTDGQLKATYTVAPGADPSAIRWRYDGAGAARIDARGDLRVELTPGARGLADPGRHLIEHAPVAWQDVAGRRRPVEIRYTVFADGSVGFALPNGYDPTQPLTLDPTLTYSTFLGGGGDDSAYDVAVDTLGSTYVVGRTLSVDFPVSGAIDPGCGTDGSCDSFGFYDAFVSKLDTSAAGAASLVFSTYLGGSANDFGLRIRTRNGVTGGPQIYLAGIARSGFPTTSNAYDQTYGSPPAVPVGADAFFAVLTGDGSQLLYSTYLGGGNGDGAWGLDIEPSGIGAIVGQTYSNDFPLVAALDSSCGTDGTCDTDQSDAFVARVDPAIAGSGGLLYATYLGGSGSDQAYGVMRDAQGRSAGERRQRNPHPAGHPLLRRHRHELRPRVLGPLRPERLRQRHLRIHDRGDPDPGDRERNRDGRQLGHHERRLRCDAVAPERAGRLRRLRDRGRHRDGGQRLHGSDGHPHLRARDHHPAGVGTGDRGHDRRSQRDLPRESGQPGRCDPHGRGGPGHDPQR